MTNLAQELIVYVNQDGTPTGETAPKLAAHHAQTRLHLAFSCYVFNDNGEFLVTQRAHSKKVWPSVWTNSVCGHPAPGEKIEDAIARRADFELGMKVTDTQILVPKYTYTTPPYNGIIEREFCPIFIACASSDPQPNPEEVEAWKWIKWQDFVTAAHNDSSDTYSWWCKDQLKLISDNSLIQKYSEQS